jgi:hypothetical protein
MVEALTFPWRIYPAAALVVVGTALAVSGLVTVHAGRHQRGRPELDLAYRYLLVFRQVVVGLALAAAGMGWAWHVPWLVAASLCVGAGELLESSAYIWVLRWGQRRDLRSPS